MQKDLKRSPAKAVRVEVRISSHQITQSKFRKTFVPSSKSMESFPSTGKKKTTKISTTTCSTKMMKSRIQIKICFSMTMIKRFKCYKN